MKAIVYTRYGPPDVLQLQEPEKPLPKANEVLVRVHAASVNALDWRQFSMPIVARLLRGGMWQPKDTSFGVDVAGRVEAIGKAVTQFQPGDEVLGLCRGACAEYVCTFEEKLVRKPAHLSLESAAAVPLAGLTALQAVRDQGQVRAGQKIVISGAGGGVGTFAVQLAKYFGAEVTAVCSTRNQGMAQSIGADHVVDYTREDFTRNGQAYDVIVAANGFYSDFRLSSRADPDRHFCRRWRRHPSDDPDNGTRAGDDAPRRQELPRGDDETQSTGHAFSGPGLLETGAVVPVIDRRYSLSDVPDAVRYLLQGHASGKVVIEVLKSE